MDNEEDPARSHRPRLRRRLHPLPRVRQVPEGVQVRQERRAPHPQYPAAEEEAAVAPQPGADPPGEVTQ